MPKRVSEETKRVALNCLVLPETLRYLKAAAGSQGVVVDRAVAALRVQEAQKRVMAETGDPWRAIAAAPGDNDFKMKRQQIREASRILRQTRRGPRQKGDKTR